jgi:hypothetical protein
MAKLHESKNLVAFDGARYLVGLYRNAGFVDIEIIKGSVDNGTWRKGSTLPQLYIIDC